MATTKHLGELAGELQQVVRQFKLSADDTSRTKPATALPAGESAQAKTPTDTTTELKQAV
jgi:hypothetical protein